MKASKQEAGNVSDKPLRAELVPPIETIAFRENLAGGFEAMVMIVELKASKCWDSLPRNIYAFNKGGGEILTVKDMTTHAYNMRLCKAVMPQARS